MKLPKFTKKTKLRIAQAASVAAYSAVVAVYGILNYEEGKQAEWDYITNTADSDKTGNMIFKDRETGDSYLMVGKRLTDVIHKDISGDKAECRIRFTEFKDE